METSVYGMVWDWFWLWYYMDWDYLLFPFLLLYRLRLPSAFRSEYYTGLGLPSCFLSEILYKFGTAFLIEYYTGFGLVLS